MQHHCRSIFTHARRCQHRRPRPVAPGPQGRALYILLSVLLCPLMTVELTLLSCVAMCYYVLLCVVMCSYVRASMCNNNNSLRCRAVSGTGIG